MPALGSTEAKSMDPGAPHGAAGTSFEQFKSALQDELARRNLGLPMSDDAARLMLANDALTRSLYEQWVVDQAGETGEAVPQPRAADAYLPPPTAKPPLSAPGPPSRRTRLPVKWLAWVGGALALIVGVVIAVTAGGDDQPVAAPSRVPTTSKPTPSPTRTPTPTPTPTPTTPEATTFVYRCGDAEFKDFRAAWEAETPSGCYATQVTSWPLTDTEELALTTAYGEVNAGSLHYLYGICAGTASYPWAYETLSPSQALEVSGALVICPDHPKAAAVAAALAEQQAAAAQQQAAAAQQAVDEQLRAEGRLIGPGSYLIGVDILAGTWQSEGERVEDCYWEVSDAQGNIMDNNFISVAPQFTITVPAGAAGLTISGCTFRWIGP